MDKKRRIVQIISTFIQNIKIKNFFLGTIYTGTLKKICVPGMNCYSCPASIGSCPIGSLQNLVGGNNKKSAAYIIGFLSLIGILVGRFVCGWICVFGFIQELLYKIPTKKFKIPQKIDSILRKLKYVILFIFVILLPIILKDEYGISVPYFCKLLCPVGTLEGALPLMIVDKVLRSAAHWLFAWKLFILILIILSSIFIYRPFCKYLCPLGAFYSLFQKISFLKINYEKQSCISCGKCEKSCNMGVNPIKNPNSMECIRCGKCITACPTKSLTFNKGKNS